MDSPGHIFYHEVRRKVRVVDIDIEPCKQMARGDKEDDYLDPQTSHKHGLLQPKVLVGKFPLPEPSKFP